MDLLYYTFKPMAKKTMTIILLLFCMWLIYYFHFVLHSSVVFTHLFYIPIILSALWWNRFSFVVAILLGVGLIVSHILTGQQIAASDVSRAIVFIFVAAFSSYLVRINHRQSVKVAENAALSKAKAAIEKSEKQLRQLIETAPYAIMIQTAGRIVFLNQAAIKLYGAQNPTQMKSTAYSDRIHPQYQEQEIKCINNILHTRQDSGYFESKHQKADHTVFDVEVSMAPLNYNDQPGTLIFVKDTTRDKEAEELLRQLELSKESTRRHHNFLANMSHEMRTPIIGILGFTKLIAQTPLTPDQQDFVQMLQTSSENLDDVITRLLEYQQLQSGNLKPNPRIFPFRDIIKSAEQYHQQQQNRYQKQLDFQTSIHNDIPEYINADKTIINQITKQLLSNAFKFTHVGKITLQAEVLQNAPNKKDVLLKIQITDTGIGIPAEKHEKLFEPFAPIEQDDQRNYEGTGVGLTICKDLVKILEGEMGFTSQPGKGSSFWFSFPAEASDLHKLNQTV